jgi:hypothetical protein
MKWKKLRKQSHFKGCWFVKKGLVVKDIGDFVRFPKGLSCIWDIEEPVKKHYDFK